MFIAPFSFRSLPIFRFWISVFCGYLALGATLQVLPVFLVQKFNASPLIVGTIIGIASFAAAFARPIAGRAADNGQARRVVLMGSLLGILGGFGHMWSPNLSILLVSRILLGVGEGALFTGAITLIINNCERERRGTLAGWFGLSMWGGLCAGPVLATWINHVSNNIFAVWTLVMILPLIGFLLVSTASITPHTLRKQIHEQLVLLPHGARLPGLTFLLACYGYGTINAILILYLDQAQLSGQNVALPLFAAAFLLSRIIGSPFITLFGGRLILLICILIEIIGLILISHPILTMILIGTALTGIGTALLYPAFVAILSARVPLSQQGAAIGFMTSFWDFGLVLAGPIGGIIATSSGFSHVFLVAAILSLISFFIVLGPLRYPFSRTT